MKWTEAEVVHAELPQIRERADKSHFLVDVKLVLDEDVPKLCDALLAAKEEIERLQLVNERVTETLSDHRESYVKTFDENQRLRVEIERVMAYLGSDWIHNDIVEQLEKALRGGQE